MADTENSTPKYDDEMKGVLFVNDKGGNSARPDYRGHVVIEGTTYRLSGWKKRAKQSGQTFLSLAVTPDRSGPVEGEGDDGF